MTVALIYGGKSGEHEVSIISATSIARYFPKEHTIILIGITKTGEWFLQDDEQLTSVRQSPDSSLHIQQRDQYRVFLLPGGGAKGALRIENKTLHCDVVFPILHGTFGEDGTIQGLFEMTDLPYVGGGVLASSLAMDKEKAKILWKAAGLPIIPFIAVTRSQWNSTTDRQAILRRAELELCYPLFVKPSCAGSSVGASKAAHQGDLILRIDEAFLWDDKIIIEPFIHAREIECSVTGNEHPTAYTPGEIIPSHEFYDYEAKYTDPDGASLRIPAELTELQTKKVRQLAVAAYKTLDLCGLSRVDFFIDKNTEELSINEINTLPGFTPISMFPKMCGASGLGYPELLVSLCELAIERFAQKRSLTTSRM